MRRLALVAVLASATAHADPAADVLATLLKGYGNLPKTLRPPHFLITFGDPDEAPDSSNDFGSLLVPTNAPSGTPKDPVSGMSADGTAGWAAADVTPSKCIRGALPDDTSGDTSYYEGERCMWEQKGAFARWALVVERVGAAWQPVAWHLYGVAPGFVGPAAFGKLTAAVPAGAKDAVAAFTASLADPKAMTASLSPRKDTALFGSAAGERFVGARAIGAALAKWNLAFSPSGGVRAGTAGKSVAWVAANLQAVPIANKKKKPSYYHVVFVYEHAGDKWQLVQATFSDEDAPK